METLRSRMTALGLTYYSAKFLIYAHYNETLLYQGYENNIIQRKFTIWDHKHYLVVMKPHYISVLYNESPLYKAFNSLLTLSPLECNVSILHNSCVS